MGAAAQTDPVLSLLFFYTYRLTMTLAVFPLLFAFIIQAFITKRDLESQSKKDTTSATRTGGDDGGHSGVPTTQNSSKFRDKGICVKQEIVLLQYLIFGDLCS